MTSLDVCNTVGQVEKAAVELNLDFEEYLLYKLDYPTDAEFLTFMRDRSGWLKRIDRVQWMLKNAKEKMENYKAYLADDSEAVEEI